jgi:hypothetical protein
MEVKDEGHDVSMTMIVDGRLTAVMKDDEP